jgi:hypothetical protein
MATKEGNSLIGGTIGKHPVERAMDMAEVGEASGAAVEKSGMTMHMSFVAAGEQWERNKNGKRLWNETSVPVSALGDWRHPMERTVRQLALEVTHLHKTIDWMARMLEAHAAGDKAQWLGFEGWLEVSEMMWDEHHKDNVLWGTHITDITAEVLAEAKVCGAALA